MAKQVFINLPVSDLERSAAFYEALGFTNNPMFSDENAVSMMWSDEIVFMLLKRDFYQSFLQDKTVADTKTSSGALIALSLDSKAAVEEFVRTAEANGGTSHRAGPEMPEDTMIGYEVIDPDGNQLEPFWMNPHFDPTAQL